MGRGRVGIPALALLVSLLAHLGLVAIAARWRRPTPPPALPIELEIVEVPARRMAAGAADAPGPGAGLPPGAGRAIAAPPPGTPGDRGRPKRAAPAALPEAADTVASGDGREPPPGPASALEPAAAGPEAAPAAGRDTVLAERPPDLQLRWPAAGAGEGGAGEGGTGPALPPPPAADPADALSRKVQGILTADAPFRRARESADPYWIAVKERLSRDFVVPAEVLEDRADGGFGPQNREAARAYLAQAKQFGETGNPERPEIYAPHAAAIPGVDEDLLRFQRAQVRRTEPGEDAMRLVTWIRIGFTADGTVEQVSLERSSGLPAHDRLALEAARALPSLGPRPPDQAATIWAFESLLWIVPPLPMVGCAFDATFIPTECFYPLKRFTRSRVRLEALP